MVHSNYKVIEDCDTDGTHLLQPRECKVCGTVFCKNCAGTDIDGNGHELMLCPGCGFDTEEITHQKTFDTISNTCTECNGENGYHDYPERECPACGTIFGIACCGGKLFCLSRTKVSTLQNKTEVYDKDSTICPSCGYATCDFYTPKESDVVDPDDIEKRPETIFDILDGMDEIEDTDDDIVSDIFAGDDDFDDSDEIGDDGPFFRDDE